ncbi:MAG: TIR domain-containing protein [Clostridia bacterium]|nr:TIR domain-containing protein [Clostridia bacterium]
MEDPNTFEYLPTCHRASFDSFLEDPDYLAALAHSDGVTKRQYQKDAAKIAEVQRGILATSQNEEPFDVFNCYKESEDDGSRTRDSLYAQDIYYQLTEQGRRVFFSRITLEDKAGTEYEPYIFAALNSARVMILVTTSAEHAGAVWVKNEWSRFLSLMRKDRTKLLLPCYRDMDPYDLPEALSVLQSYDMSKIGFIQDLIRGVNKVLDGAKSKDKPQETVVKETVIEKHESGSANIASLLDRAFLALEDGEWERADGFCEQVLNLDSRNAQAYLGKLMAERHVRKREALRDCAQPFDDSNNYKKALRFGDDKLKQELTGAVAFIQDRNETARKEGVYQKALTAMAAKTEQGYREAAELFGTIPEYKDAAAQREVCAVKAEEARKNGIYAEAVAFSQKESEECLKDAIRLFRSISGWRDADERIPICEKRIEEIRARQEAQRMEAERKAEARKRKNKRLAVILAAVAAVIITVILLVTKVIIPNREYNEAIALYEAGQHKEALATFFTLNGYKDSDRYIHACWDHVAVRNAIAAGSYHTVGLKADGTVVAVGYNEYGQCDVSDWKNIRLPER